MSGEHLSSFPFPTCVVQWAGNPTVGSCGGGLWSCIVWTQSEGDPFTLTIIHLLIILKPGSTQHSFLTYSPCSHCQLGSFWLNVRGLRNNLYKNWIHQILFFSFCVFFISTNSTFMYSVVPCQKSEHPISKSLTHTYQFGHLCILWFRACLSLPMIGDKLRPQSPLTSSLASLLQVRPATVQP